MPETIFQLHLFSTWYMVGLIWFVQLVHYPLMHHVGFEEFAAYSQSHQSRTFFAVLPMLLEGLTGGALLAFADYQHSMLYWTAFGLMIVHLSSTAFLQVPCHEKLLDGYDKAVVTRLVHTNWIRTIAWTLRGLLLVIIVGQS